MLPPLFLRVREWTNRQNTSAINPCRFIVAQDEETRACQLIVSHNRAISPHIRLKSIGEMKAEAEEMFAHA